MSDDGPVWFAPKRYGYGSGLPVCWQGWALTLAYAAIVGTIAVRFNQNLLVSGAIFIPVTVAFCVISARTTRGGWKWRWGDEG
jgi:hypothetical protein